MNQTAERLLNQPETDWEAFEKALVVSVPEPVLKPLVVSSKRDVKAPKEPYQAPKGTWSRLTIFASVQSLVAYLLIVLSVSFSVGKIYTDQQNQMRDRQRQYQQYQKLECERREVISRVLRESQTGVEIPIRTC